MAIKRSWALAGGIGGIALLGIPVLAQRAPTSGPVARYDVRAGTVSGFAAMGGGMGGAMNMAFGGGGDRVQHELLLRLGSSQGPLGGPAKADHFMPAGAKLGKSVALVTPVQERGPGDQLPGQRDGQKPSGRLLVFWGCGEHAPQRPAGGDRLRQTHRWRDAAGNVVRHCAARLGPDAAEQQDLWALAG